MARDVTAEDHVETILYRSGVRNSGDIASEIIEDLRDAGMLVETQPETVTPTQGNMTQKEHTAFILRVFMYWVERQTSKQVDVDLRDVLAVTRGRQMQVQLDGHMFSARTIADLTLPTAEERRSVQ